MQTIQISYRIANTSDIESIAIIHSNSWKRSYRGIYTDHYLDFEVDNDRMKVWKQRFESPENQHIIVAEFENKVIGFICIFLNKETEFGSLIDNLQAKFEFQGKGIGKMLLQKAAIYIKQKTDTDAMFKVSIYFDKAIISLL